MKQETLSEIGEEEILNRLKKFMDKDQAEDDTAEINLLNKKLIINTDLLVENVHFSQTTTSYEDIGWKAITSNFSDLACSGVKEIIGVTIGLVAPPKTTWDWVEGVYIGMSEALNQFGGKILGGDCSRGSQKTLSITALGICSEVRLHRANAIPGDLIITTGPHGLSRLGFALLTNEVIEKKIVLTKELQLKAIKAHQRPIPALEALKKIEQSKPASLPWRCAGTDSSDGLLNAIENICKSSSCSALLSREKMPKVKDWPDGDKWNNWCANGGEDYELIACLPKEWVNSLNKILPNLIVIGEIKKGDPEILWKNNDSISKYLKPEFTHY